MHEARPTTIVNRHSRLVGRSPRSRLRSVHRASASSSSTQMTTHQHTTHSPTPLSQRRTLHTVPGCDADARQSTPSDSARSNLRLPLIPTTRTGRLMIHQLHQRIDPRGERVEATQPLISHSIILADGERQRGGAELFEADEKEESPRPEAHPSREEALVEPTQAALSRD